MKKSIKLIIGLVSMAIIYILFGSSNSYAASASVTANNKNVSVGDSVTVTVSLNAATWSVYVDGAASDSIVGYNQDLNNQSVSKSYNINTSNPGTYTVSISGSVKDADGTKVTVSDSTTINVSQKSSGESSTGGNNTNTQTPEKTASFSSTNQTVYATGTVNVRSGCSTSSSVVGSLKEGESVTRIGIGDNGWSKVTYNGSTCYVSSTYLTTQKKDKPDEEEKEDDDDEKSSDTTLKSLEITPKGISPEFKPETTTYSLEVNADIKKLEIKATPSNEKSKVSITGNDSLKVGDNTVKITVTSEDGKTKTYTINVKKKDKAVTVGLTTLKLDKYTLTPSFSSDVYEYKLSITDTDISKLDLSAMANEENAKVEITGNENLKNGQNVITITVTSANGEDKAVYKIYANVSQATTLSQKVADTTADNSKSKLPLYVGVGLIVLLVIIMIAIIVKNKRNNELYDEDDDEDDENYKDEVQDDLYNFKSDDFNFAETNKNTIAEENNTYEDSINKAEGFANTHEDNASEEESKLSDTFEEVHDLSEKDKIREDYLNQFNFNPYSEEGSGDVENTSEDSYKDLYGTTASESSSENNYLSTDVDYDYKPKKSKGKHSM